MIRSFKNRPLLAFVVVFGVVCAGTVFQSTSAEPWLIDPSTVASVPPNSDYRLTLVASNGDFEDRVELDWDEESPAGSIITITRDGAGIVALARTETSYVDRTGTPGVSYNYCVVVTTNGSDSTPACATGSKIIFRPTAMSATDGELETGVRVSWSDRSFVEDKYVITRDGNPLATLNANTATYLDETAVADTRYTYSVKAVVTDGATPGESEAATDEGWRGFVTPPAEVSATDGQFTDRVRVSWVDQSILEQFYTVYRFDGSGQTGTSTNLGQVVDPDQEARETLEFDDLTAVANTAYTYCVTGTTGGLESISVCDAGRRSGLAGPTVVVASDNLFDDRVKITWNDVADSEDGFIVLRDGVALDTTGPNVVTYADYTAAQDVTYSYCVQAVSTDDPANHSTSEQLCDTGTRLAVLAPQNMSATDEEFEQWVTLNWTNPSTTATLFKILRDGQLIDTVPFSTLTHADEAIESDVAYNYCVVGVTLVGASKRARAQLVGLLASLRSNSAGLQQKSASVASVTERATQVYEALATAAANGSMGASATGLVDSTPVCDTGSRSLGAPTDVAATFDEFENRVEITWIDNASGESGYRIYRSEGTTLQADATKIDSVSATRTSYGDYKGVPGTTYTYGVRAYDRYGSSLPGSDTGQRTIIPPTGLVAADGKSEYSVTLTWNDNSRVEKGYTIVSSQQNGGDRQEHTTSPNVTRFVDVRPDRGRVRFYEVKAFDDFGSSTHIQDEGHSAVLPPINVTASKTYSDRVVLTWVNVSQVADRWQTGVRTIGTEGNGGAVRGGSNSISTIVYPVINPLTGVADNTKREFCVSVRAQNSTGLESEVVCDIGFSTPEVAGLATGGRAPSPPSDVLATSGLTDRIQISWSDNSNVETGYWIFRREVDKTLVRIGTTNANKTSFDDFTAPPGDGFEYCVAAIEENFIKEYGEGVSAERCATGWRKANGTISGRIAALGGGGTRDVKMCISPDPNRGLLFDGNIPVPTLCNSAGCEKFRYAPDATRLRVAPFQIEGGGLNEFTLEMWVRTRSENQGTLVNYVGNLGLATILIKHPRNLSIQIGGSAAQFTGVSVNDGEWHHIALVWSSSGSTLLYKDGFLASNLGLIAAGEVIDSGSALYFGYQAASPFLPDRDAYLGEIDEVRLWSERRPTSTISSMRADKLTGSEPALIGYWPFDAGIRAVAPDLTGLGNDGELVGGVAWTDGGAPIDACATTDSAGNYALPGVRYGASTEFVVTPSAPRRSFTPPFKTITLTTDSPVQNEVGFTDNTAFTLSGGITFDGTMCPVPDVSLFLADVKSGVVGADVLKGTSELDGSWSISADPSLDATDLRRIKPRFVNEQDAGDVHVFTPMLSTPLFVDSDQSGLDFVDTKTRRLSGFYGSSCGFPIGTATLKITTENGCYERQVETNADGSFAFDLPPQKYLVEVLDVSSSPLRAAVISFFDAIGTQAIDLTLQPDTLDLIYHAPLKITVGGLPSASNSCPANEITQIEDGIERRKFSVVPLLTLGDKITLDVEVAEDYGTLGECPATAGTLTLFDSIAEVPEVSFDIKDGPAEYEMIVGSPNVFAGARVEGIDRSFQKSFTAVASVPGQPLATQTEWVIVQGARARTGTFITVPSEPIPLFALHDPPGDNSYSYIAKGSSMCTGMDFSDTYSLVTSGEQKTLFGLSFIAGTAFGGLFATETKFFGGVTAGLSGTTDSNTTENGFSLCMTTEETFSTSADPAFVGPDADVFVGIGLNFTFSEADRLSVTEQCQLSVDDILGVGIDVDDPIATTYHFTRGLLRDTMIPQLRENAERETGAAKTEQENAIRRFEQLLEYDAALGQDEAFSLLENHSFSAGADVNQSVTYDSTGYRNTGAPEELVFAIGAAGEIDGTGVKSEFSLNAVRTYTENKITTNGGGSSFQVGYVLSDDDQGDFFTVDVGQSQCVLTERSTDDFTVVCDKPLPISNLRKPPFAPGGELLFKLRSGTSSNPWEPITQKRDLALLSINPPVRADLGPDEPAVFTLTLTNAGESQEERSYVLRTAHTSNPGGAVLSAQGSPIHDGLEFTLGAQQSQEVTLSVERGPSVYSYKDLQVDFYPPDDVQSAASSALKGTVTFDVDFLAPCSDISIQRPRQDWRLNASTILPGLDIILNQFTIPVSEADSVGTLGLEYRRLGAGDPTGNVWLPAVKTGVNRRSPLESDSLAVTRTDWQSTWDLATAGVADGEYEVRAFTECIVAGPAGKVFSESLRGIVDTKAPKVLGSAEPGDRVLALGDNIEITFDEELGCSSITAGTNVTLVYGDGAEQGNPIGIETVCDGRRVVIDLDPNGALTWPDLEGRLLKARFDRTVTDVLGNPLGEDIEWSFTVRRSAVAWNPSALVAEVPYRAFVTLSSDLVNGRAEEAGYTLSGNLLAFSPQSGILEAGGKQAIEFVLDGSLAPGVHTGEIHAAVVVGGETLDIVLPVSITVSDFQQQAISLAQGWTWFSTNRVPSTTQPDSVLSSLNASGGDLIKSQTAFDLYDFGSGSWVGSLGSIENGKAYQIKLGRAATLVVAGTEIDPASPISVTPGWNWIGYLPQVKQGLRDALNSLSPSGAVASEGYLGDLIKSQYGFAQFDGTNWSGSLTEMEPGLGYMLRSRSGGTLTYPTPAEAAAKLLAGNNKEDGKSLPVTTGGLGMESGGAAAGWSPNTSRTLEVDELPLTTAASPMSRSDAERLTEESATRKLTVQHAFSMTLTGQVMLDGESLVNSASELRAVVGDEIVGQANLQFVESLQAYRVFLMVYGEEGDGVELEVFDAATETAYRVGEPLTFAADAMFGSPQNPVLLEAETEAYKAARAAAELPERFELIQNYPNPFNPQTTIRFGLPVDGEVTLEVFDVLGRRVASLLERDPYTAGWHQIVFDARQLASASYFYRISTSSKSIVKRMVVLK